MKNTNTVILARVSSKSQEDEGYSLDSQLKLLRSYCENKDLTIAKVFRIAETASKEQSRKIFNELLKHIKKNDITHLAVEKTDRLTRNLRDAVAVDDWLQANPERRLHAVKESLIVHKEATSDVKFMWNIHLAVAKKFADNLREEAMKGWDEKLAQGWMPAPPPAGYKTVIKSGKRIHVINLETAPRVKRAFKRYLLEGESLASITQYLADQRVFSRTGRPITKSNVQRLLMNPFYTGTILFNGKTYPGAQEPLIDIRLYDDVQTKMHSGRPSKIIRHNPVLKNVIICESCDKVVTWQKQKGKYYGSCQRKTEACKQSKYIREETVEEDILKSLQYLVCPSPKILAWTVDAINKDRYEATEQVDETIKATAMKIKRIKTMDEMLYDDKLASEIDTERYDQKHSVFKKQLVSLKTELKTLEESPDDNHNKYVKILKLTQNAATEFQRLEDNDAKRSILIELFQTLTLKNNSVSVTFTKFVELIGRKSEESRQLLKGSNMHNRTNKNDHFNSGHDTEFELLRPVWQGRQDLNLRHLVLETSALPAELRPYVNV